MNVGGRPAEARLIADDLVSIRAPDAVEAQRIARTLRDGRWIEVVPGADSVVVQFDNSSMSPEAALGNIEALLRQGRSMDPLPSRRCALHVRYGGDDGPDLADVCRQLGVSRSELIALHSSVEYRVDMLGFTPGFAYLGGLDPRLNVPRLARPRQRVAAGSVGIAGGRTGIYALPGPGGWPLIGRVDEQLFDASAEDPFVLAPGTRVRFAVSSATP